MVVVVVLVVLVAVALVVAAHWYVWRRLVRDTARKGGVARRAGTVAAFVLPVLAVSASGAGRSGAPFWVQRLVAWPGYLWLAVLMYLLLALLVGEAVRPLLRRYVDGRAEGGAQAGARAEGDVQARTETQASEPVGQPVAAPAGPGGSGGAGGTADSAGAASSQTGAVLTGRAPSAAPVPSRRLFVSRVVAGAAATAAAATVGYGTYGVLRGPRVKRITVPLAKLPRAAHGYRIAVVSDIHLGPILGRAHTQRIVDTINSTRPDLVAVVGDLVDGTVKDLGPAAVPLAGLEAPHGAFFVTGNHEYFSGAQEWVDHVRELGLRPLVNERVEIAGFDLAGVNDIAGESEGDGPDFAKALGDRDRARASVLLAHQPIVIHDAVRHGVDLQLSGHTHGGQLWPGNYLAELANPTVAGLERYGDTQLYVTRGAGAWGPPVRVGAPSDITVVELASRQA
ncbi:metallophosphoesterase [Streptomyces sp. NPDC006638]|uniref:metallophosphoesterase n=1 Tax=Streptomyces sp. NPDC006638 TaxID=3157183 RepID=UPI0033AE3AA5